MFPDIVSSPKIVQTAMSTIILKATTSDEQVAAAGKRIARC